MGLFCFAANYLEALVDTSLESAKIASDAAKNVAQNAVDMLMKHLRECDSGESSPTKTRAYINQACVSLMNAVKYSQIASAEIERCIVWNELYSNGANDE